MHYKKWKAVVALSISVAMTQTPAWANSDKSTVAPPQTPPIHWSKVLQETINLPAVERARFVYQVYCLVEATLTKM